VRNHVFPVRHFPDPGFAIGKMSEMNLARQTCESAPVNPRHHEHLRQDAVIERRLVNAHFFVKLVKLHRPTLSQ
jgi:hypothetical protein